MIEDTSEHAGVIYGLHDGDFNYRYVGQTRYPLSVRMSGHRTYSKRYPDWPIYRWAAKTGWENVRVCVIATFDETSLWMMDEREKFYITQCRAIIELENLNILDGGNIGRAGKIHSEETKQKMRDAHRRRAASIGCSVEGCTSPHKSKGYCSDHCDRSRPPKKSPERPKVVRVCSLEGCEKPHTARGYCHTHYSNSRLYGHPTGGKLPDLTGRTFGKLIVVSRIGKQWECLCECGTKKITTRRELNRGDVVSCGKHREGNPVSGLPKIKSNHIRWHVKRDLVNPDCVFCVQD